MSFAKSFINHTSCGESRGVKINPGAFPADFLAETPTDTKVCKSKTPKCSCSFLHSEIPASGSFQRNLTDPEFSSIPSAVIFTQTSCI